MGQTTQGLTNNGQTAHYQISYDTSLSPSDGLTRAQGLMDKCELDFHLIAGWFSGVNFEFSFPIGVQINNATGGASWDDPPDISLPFGYSPTVQINPGSGTTVDFIRYLLVQEVTEMFMASQNAGWFESSGTFHGADEGSKGEGLSRFLGFQFKLANGLQSFRYPTFEVVSIWLNSARPDFVNNNPDDNQPDIVNGCTTCFLYYLHNQLGFSINAIIGAAAGNLGEVHSKLTGRADGWPAFISLVNLHYPPGLTYNPAGDNIFPVPNLANLSNDELPSGSSQVRRILSLDTQAPAEVTVALSSDNPAVLTIPAQVTVPVGDWAAGIALTAAPVTGPAQGVTIRASYAGKTLLANIEITPRPSILSGQVTDSAFRPIADATVLLKSDIEIIPGGGNTLQLSTDAGGFYVTPTIPPHIYQVSAVASSYVPGQASVTVSQGVPVTTQNFILALTKPFTIVGQVLDAARNPIAGATITLNENSAIPGRIQIKTDASGHYSVSMNPGPYNGTFTIVAEATGFVPGSVTLTIPNGATITQDFFLGALGIVAGFVRDSAEAPVAGATLTVGALSAASDATGHYTLPGVTPGPTSVAIRAAGYDATQLAVNVLPGVVTPLDFVLVKATAVIAGVVTDADSGRTLSGATVSAGGLGVMKTGHGGQYTFSGVPAGQFQISVSAARYFSQQTTVQAVDNQTTELDFELDRQGPAI
jgi:hypothetical protein